MTTETETGTETQIPGYKFFDGGESGVRSTISHGLINQCVKLGDIICIMLAGYIAGKLYTPITMMQSLLISLLAIYPYRMISGNRRVYRWDCYQLLRWEVLDLLVGLCSAAVVIGIFVQLFKPGQDIVGWLIVWTASAVLAVMLLRLGTRLIVGRLDKQGALMHHVAIIGAGTEGIAVVDHLKERRLGGNSYEIIGIFDERKADRRAVEIDGIAVTQGIDSLIEISRNTKIDVIIVALPLRAQERIAFMMQKLNAIPADILLMMEISWLKVKDVQLRNLQGYSFLQVARRPLIGTLAVLKRIEDYSVALIGIILMSPIMLLAALAIWLEDRGPVLFYQRRVGFNQREFNMLKFRSMALDPKDDGTRGTTENDPRITRVGRFIRKTSIDELPQLFNVLLGQMSVVGPRAHVPAMLVDERTYPETVIEYAARHRVKPGITGWAQINGMRGGIHNEAKARRGVELDLEYIERWTPWLDIQIMLRTLLGGMWGRSVF